MNQQVFDLPEKFQGLFKKARYKSYYGGRGAGKAISKDEWLPTPSGWVRLGDVQIGETLFDEAGQPCKVLNIFDYTPENCYRLTFSDGTQIDCCADHRWTTWSHVERKSFLRATGVDNRKFPHNWPQWRHQYSDIGPQVRTTQEIVNTLVCGVRGDTNHCIPVCSPIQCSERLLPIDPYILGYWLGNGTSSDGQVFPGSYHGDLDFPFVQFVWEANAYDTTVYKHGTLASRRLRRELKENNLIHNKHVPEIYFRASVTQRLALLQGLMDSDGTTGVNKIVASFSNTNKNLADSVYELAASLGQKPIITERRATLYGKDCGPCYQVDWRPTLPVFLLPRKAKKISQKVGQELRHRHRMIVSAEPIETSPMRCLTVDSPNAMFLVSKAFIPTHNTECIGRYLVARAYTEKQLILCARQFQNSIQDSSHRVIVGAIFDLGLQAWFDIQKTTIYCTLTGSQFIFKGLERNIREIKGMKGVHILWIDEAQSVPAEAYLIIDPTIREHNSELIVSFNPDREIDATYDLFVTNRKRLGPPEDVICEKVNWNNNPFFPPGMERQRQNMLAYDPDHYDWVWEGACRIETEASVFRNKYVIKTFDEAPEKTRFYHGLDFGFSVDPLALVRCWIKPSEEVPGKEDLMVDREAYGHQIELDQMPDFFDATVETARFWPIIADSENPAQISYLARQGYSVVGAEKWKGCKEDGIQHLKAFHKIYIHERLCPNVAREFRLFSYKVDKKAVDVNGKHLVLPILEEKNDHGVDAILYSINSMIQHRGGLGMWGRLLGKN